MKLPLPRRELHIALWLALLGSCVGWLLDAPLWGLVAGITWSLLRHLYELHLLARWAEDTTQDVPDSPGTWGSCYSAIHQLRKNEHRAKDSLLSIIERARASISALDEGVALIDKDGNLEWWNPSAQKLLGLRARDMGQPLINILRAPAFIRYFQHGPFEDGLRLPSHRYPGRHLQFEITLFGDNDKILIVYDITQLHNLEQVRKDFVANVSHELRTPLTVLSGYLETMLDQADAVGPRWQKALTQMAGQATRMKNLVNDLLLLSRLENQGLSTALHPVDVPRLLRQIHHDALVLAEPKQQTVHLELEEQLFLNGAQENLRSALSNLVTNAIKYTPAGGQIEMRWHETEQGAQFTVRDTGIGIAAEHLPRLTERFYRVDAGRSTHTGGTGLGLAIVKHVLMQHGGTLQIQSTPGVGSTFTCDFPRHLVLSGPSHAGD